MPISLGVWVWRCPYHCDNDSGANAFPPSTVLYFLVYTLRREGFKIYGSSKEVNLTQRTY